MKKMIITLVFSLFALTGAFGQQNVNLALELKLRTGSLLTADKKGITLIHGLVKYFRLIM